MYSREQYGAGEFSGLVDGSELVAEPAVEIGIGNHVTLGPELLWERRWAEPAGERYLWEGRNAWEPALRIVWSSALLDASVRGAFRNEEVDEEFKSDFFDDNWSFRAGGDIAVMPISALSIHLFADYQYRGYPVLVRVTENVSISTSATVKF